MPNNTMANMTSVVITGRLMKSAAMFISLFVVRGSWFAGCGASHEPRATNHDQIAFFTSTLLFGVNRNWPSVTTVSPGATPLSTMVS